MRKEELATQLRVPLFADRATIDEAYEYFFEVAGAINDADRAAMLTATGVLLNTVANEINKLEG